MIDIGLTKLALIGVVALVVIGPEKLPRVARTVGTLFGRAQRYISQVKSEVSREIELDEMRKMQAEMQATVSEVEQTIARNVAQTERDFRSGYGRADDALLNHLRETPTPDQLALKAKDFRRKKLVRMSAVPTWYKHQHGRKTRVMSGAARVAKYRPAYMAKKSTASFY